MYLIVESPLAFILSNVLFAILDIILMLMEFAKLPELLAIVIYMIAIRPV